MYLFLPAGPEDLQDIASLRNSIRGNLTHNQELIDPTKQEHWFNNIKKPEDLLYALKLENSGSLIGYGFIQTIEGAPWLTGAINPNYQGQGAGEFLFTNLCRECVEPAIYLDVLKDNFRAINLYFKLGFKIINSSDTLFIMRKFKHE